MAQDDCVFCKISRKELPAWIIVENESVIGILDTNPAAAGHCLIIPKRHVRYWQDLTDAETSAVFKTAKRVAKKIKAEYKPDFICVFIRGGRVSHTHVVLFPSEEGDQLSGFPQSVLGKANINLKQVQEQLRIE